jgi:HlyD family secretion protein
MDITRKPRRPIARIVMTAAAATVALVCALVFWRSTAAAAMPTADRASVWTEKVRRGPLVLQVAAQGTFVPEHVQWLSAPSAGRVSHIALRAGAHVEPDTVVLTLENPDLELATLDAEHAAANAESALIQLDVRTDADKRTQESGLADLSAQLRDAQRHADAADRLAPEGLMSDLDVHAAQDKATGLRDRVLVEQGRQQVLVTGRQRQLEAQRAEVARLRDIAAFRHKQLAALEIRAGIEGVVEDVPLEEGQWVPLGTLLAKVAEPDRLKALMHVAEADAKEVHRGLSVRFETPAGGLRGHVERVDPTVVAGNVRLEVFLDGALPPGARADQTVAGYVEIATLDDVLSVGRPAGVQEGAAVGLFRFRPDGTHADRVTVRLGRASAREIQVLGGLAAGDSVIVSETSTWDTAEHIAVK